VNDTVSWFITFGLGSPDGRTYTEIQVPALMERREQERLVRATVIGRYGRQWAFDYPPEDFDSAISQYGLTLREKLVAEVPA
jgi:hypothetical protein